MLGCLALLVVLVLSKAGRGPAVLEELPRLLRVALACGCVLAASYIGWTRVRFDIAFDGRWLRFSFRNPEAARAFAARNDASVAPMPGEVAAEPATFDREPSRCTPDEDAGTVGADHDD